MLMTCSARVRTLWRIPTLVLMSLFSLSLSAQEPTDPGDASSEEVPAVQTAVTDDGSSSPPVDEQGRVLEEVFVTARKKVESLQDTPIAVTAIGGEQLQERGLTNLADLKGFVPGLDLNPSNGQTRDANPFIRGVGQRETRTTIDSSVGMYINGIYIGRNAGALLDFVDIQQVQVVRGPQGTLFGKNTTGGAIVIDTVKPENSFGGHVDATVGAFNQRNGKAAINMPLIDDVLMARLSLSSIRRDGYKENVIDGTSWFDDDRLGGMFQIRWLPSDETVVDIFYSGTKVRQRPAGTRCIYANDDRGVGPDRTAIEAGFGTIESPGFIKDICEESENRPNDEFGSNMNGSPAFPKAVYDVDTRTFGTTIDWELGEFGGVESAIFKTIVGYRNTRVDADEDLDGTKLPILERHVPKKNNTDQYSIEFQFGGTVWDELVHFTTGTFFFLEETRDDQKLPQAVGPYPFGDIQGGPTPPGILTGALFFDERETNNRSMSWFGQMDFDFTEHWQLTLGARWTWEERTTEIFESANDFGEPLGASVAANQIAANTGQDPVTVLAQLNQINSLFGTGGTLEFYVPTDECTLRAVDAYAEEDYAGYSGGQRGTAAIHFYQGPNGTEPTLAAQENYPRCHLDKDTGSLKGIRWTPMASLRYTAHDSVLDALNLDHATFYLTYSEGFRSGGVVDGVNKPSDDNPDLGGADAEEVGETDADLDSFKPELVSNAEFGVKLEALDRRLRANMAAFYTEYQDIQLTNVRVRQETGQPEPFIDNAGQAIITGFEAEIYAVLGDNWLLTFSAAYTDGDLKEYETIYLPPLEPEDNGVPQSQPIDRADEDLPNVYRTQAFLGLDYQWYTDWGTFMPGINVRYYDEVLRSFDRGSFESGLYLAPAQVFIDLRILWQLADNRTTVNLWVKNVEDVDDYVLGGIPLVDFMGGGAISFAEPRTYGLDVIYQFGE